MKKIFITIFSVGFSFFLLAILFSFFLQTKFANQKIQQYAKKIIKESNIPIKIESIEIKFPFRFITKKNSIYLQDKKIDIEKIDFKISFIPLLFKKIAFDSFNADNIEIQSIESLQNSNSKHSPSSIPSISFRSINLKNIHIQDQRVDIKGKLNIKKDLKSFFIALVLKKQNFPSSYIKLNSISSSKNNFFAFDINLNIDSFDFFAPFYKTPLHGNIKGSLSTKDSFEKIKTFIADKKTSPIISKVDLDLSIKNIKDILEDISIKSNILIMSKQKIFIPSLKIKNDIFSIVSNILVDNQKIENLDIKLQIADLNKLDSKKNLNGDLISSFFLKDQKIKGNIDVKNGSFQEIPFAINGSLNLEKQKNTYLGTFSSNSKILEENFDLNTKLSFDKKLYLENINLKSPSLEILGKLDICKNFLLEGELECFLTNLNLLKNYFIYTKKDHLTNLSAVLSSKIDLSSANNKQKVCGLFKLENYHFNNLFGKEINIELNAEDIFLTKTFDVDVKLNNARIEKLKIENGFLKLKKQKDITYDLFLNGKLRNPLKIFSNGFYTKKENKNLVSIDNFSGKFLNKDFSISNPVSVIFKEDFLSIKNLDIIMKNSIFHSDIFFDKESSNIKVIAKNFPLDFLSLNPFELSVSGYGSINLFLEKTKNNLKGNLSIDIENSKISSILDRAPMEISAKITSYIEDLNLITKIDIESNNSKKIKIDSTLPIKLNSNLFTIDKKKDLQTKALISIKAEDVLDFIDIGDNKIEGDIYLDVDIKNRISSPIIDGKILFKNGFFENYSLGTYLKNISFEGNLKNHLIEITKLEAKDEKKGKLFLVGSLNLEEKRNYPFSFDLDLKNINLIKSDMIDASLNGYLKINGDNKKSYARGNIEIEKAEFTIPNKIESTMPEIETQFYPKLKKIEIKKDLYPIYLNVKINATDKLYVKGRGVNANLKGDILLKGSYDNILAYGNLSLIRGNYLFSGKAFNLTQGSIFFNGNQIPRLAISADTHEKAVTITANLKGAINAPKLSFSSEPNLSISSIVSLLLFGEDLSGISGMQAIQVATTVATLSDGGGILEATKRSLGIDRIAVVSTSTDDPDDPDKMALQVGKYVARGVLVSYSQGTEDGSSNVAVDIDIGKGFSLSFETIQEEEQSRFTIKWGRSF